MKCPECGNENTKVLRTTKDADGETLRRRRECAECDARFTSFESYERADVELPFQVSEAAAILEKARGWLKQPARHIPVVRDATKLLERAAALLGETATSSVSGT